MRNVKSFASKNLTERSPIDMRGSTEEEIEVYVRIKGPGDRELRVAVGGQPSPIWKTVVRALKKVWKMLSAALSQ
jgi:hypothetical protein